MRRNETVDFRRMLTVQVGYDLYGYKKERAAIWRHYSNFSLDPNNVVTVKKASPLTPRDSPTLTNYANRYVFVIGGQNLKNFETDSSTEFYSCKDNKWRRAPALNQPRIFHSTCALGDMLYTFAGRVDKKKYHDTMERLNAKECVNRRESAWQLIALQTLPPRKDTAVAAISHNEIVILGGYNSDYLGDGYIFNTYTNAVKSLELDENEIQFYSWGNQCAMTRAG